MKRLIKAAIFDVDDTLLNNHPDGSTHGLHERSRLAAAHEVGQRHGIKELANLSEQTAHEAFQTASVHSLEGAIWNTLLLIGLVDRSEIDPENPLLKQMMALKNQLHEEILRREGRPFPGAVAFIRGLASEGLVDKLAIASTAIQRDIDVFLEVAGLDSYFPASRIISRELLSRPKPDPEAFDLAFATLDLPAAAKEQVWAFEDDPRGLVAAQGAGLRTCAITSRYSHEVLMSLTAPPDIIIDSYQELGPIFGIPSNG